MLGRHLGVDLRNLLFPGAPEMEKARQELRQTRFAQPALFAIEYSLAELWISWGIRPAAMIGHRIGEYVAACLAGVLSLENAIALVAARAMLMQQMPAGSMLSVSLGEDELRALLPEGLEVAVINGPDLCVVAGPTAAIELLQGKPRLRKVRCGRLQTSHAFHSTMMDPVVEPLTRLSETLELRPPQIPYVSNVTGGWITAAEATDAGYWGRHVRQAVRFGDGLGVLMASQPSYALLEVGPGNTLCSIARRHPEHNPEHVVLSSLRNPRDSQPDEAVLMRTLGSLWASGVAVDWACFTSDQCRRRVALPAYC